LIGTAVEDDERDEYEYEGEGDADDGAEHIGADSFLFWVELMIHLMGNSCIYLPSLRPSAYRWLI
jgi:hypothetical protein